VSKIFPIAIGRSARALAPTPDQQVRRRHRDCLSWPPRCDPGPPADYFTRRLLRIDGVPHELVLWIPGPHPPEAKWWEEISMWWVLRPVIPIAPPQSPDPAVNQVQDVPGDLIDGWTWVNQPDCSAY